ncbi:MAG TPA: DUF4157 domain-containing protein [Bryobacteraceae bacterium]|nr:DUF4157 domain-containing protein [Bryobacteraceae bacterium]
MRECCTTSAAEQAPWRPLTHGILQRKCSCGGGGAGIDGRCDECRANALQRRGTSPAPASAPASVHQTLWTAGWPLDAFARASMERHFNHAFGRVRVHTDSQAAESARAVHADAYTVGSHIVFAPGQYAPATSAGRSLLAHELTHVIQQEHGSGPLVAAPALAEREAERVSAKMTSGAAHGVEISPMGLNLSRQPTGGGGGSTKPKVDPAIEDARAAAFMRVFQARERVRGLSPGTPADPSHPDRQLPDIRTYEEQQKARRYAQLFFNWPNPNMEQIADILSSMMTALSPGAAINTATPGDSNCGAYAGYVIDHRPPIVLCPGYFSSTPEERIRTLVHESAHRAGIGQPKGEGYCAVFDYSGPCPGDFSAADSWAQYVNAVTDQPPDKPPSITGKAGGGAGSGSGSGGKKP